MPASGSGAADASRISSSAEESEVLLSVSKGEGRFREEWLLRKAFRRSCSASRRSQPGLLWKEMGQSIARDGLQYTVTYLKERGLTVRLSDLRASPKVHLCLWLSSRLWSCSSLKSAGAPSRLLIERTSIEAIGGSGCFGIGKVEK